MKEESSREVRLSKKLALNTGLSRREATEEIRRGEVTVNGTVEKNPATILQENDIILYKNKELTEIFPAVYFVFNKAKSMNWDIKNEKNRPSVLEIIRKSFAGPLTSLYPLPDRFCGLLIITNDEMVIEKFNQKTPVVKQLLECTLDKPVDEETEKSLEQRLSSSPELLWKKIMRNTDIDSNIITLEFYGGDLEKIEGIFRELNITCQKMDRIYFGGMTKKDIGRGWYRPLTNEEILRVKYFFNPPKSGKDVV